MRKVILDIVQVGMILGVAALALPSPAKPQYLITEIIDEAGDGGGNTLDQPRQIAVGSNGSVYVSADLGDSAFKINRFGSITEIIDSAGDGSGGTLDSPQGIAVDSNGNVYVTGSASYNAFKITPGGTITEIISLTGDGGGNTLAEPKGVAVDSSGNVYVSGRSSNNAFKITPGGTITEIIDATGDGGGNTLDWPERVAVDSSGNVYVIGRISNNVFKIATPGTCNTGGTPCTITEIIDEAGDGGGNTLYRPAGVAVDSSGNVFVAVYGRHDVFKIATPGTCSTSGTPCTITEIIDSTGDGGGNTLLYAQGIAADYSGNVYVAGNGSDNVFKIATPGTCSTSGTPCTITEIIDETGDGGGNTLYYPWDVAADSAHNVYVTGTLSENAFKMEPIPPDPRVPALSNRGLMVLGLSLLCTALWVTRRRRMANAQAANQVLDSMDLGAGRRRR
jgi:hypothetical protein